MRRWKTLHAILLTTMIKAVNDKSVILWRRRAYKFGAILAKKTQCGIAARFGGEEFYSYPERSSDDLVYT